MKTIIKIDVRAVEIGQTGRIHEKFNTLAFKNMIVGLGAVERHAIFKAGATSALNKDAEFLFCVALT